MKVSIHTSYKWPKAKFMLISEWKPNERKIVLIFLRSEEIYVAVHYSELRDITVKKLLFVRGLT